MSKRCLYFVITIHLFRIGEPFRHVLEWDCYGLAGWEDFGEVDTLRDVFLFQYASISKVLTN